MCLHPTWMPGTIVGAARPAAPAMSERVLEMARPPIVLEPITDRAWLAGFIIAHWGGAGVVRRGRLVANDALVGIRALLGGELAGVASWRTDGADREIVTLNALAPGRGVGTALVKAARAAARQDRIVRLWLITTNDNLDALRFFQRRGFRIATVYAGAVSESRRLKPSIPEIGAYGIPIRDEIELERAP